MDTRTGEVFRRDERGRLLSDDYATPEAQAEARVRMLEAERAGCLVDVEDRVARLLNAARAAEEQLTR